MEATTPTQASANALQICDASTGHAVRNVAFCDTPERAAAIVRACNAHESFVVFASIVTRLNDSDGLSPAALGYLIDRANELLKKAGA